MGSASEPAKGPRRRRHPPVASNPQRGWQPPINQDARFLSSLPAPPAVGGEHSFSTQKEREQEGEAERCKEGDKATEKKKRPPQKNYSQMSFELRAPYLSAPSSCVQRNGMQQLHFVCSLCLRQVNCVFVERCGVAGSLCSVTFNIVSYLEQKSRTEVIILLNKFRCWMRLFAPAVLWS